MKSDYYDIVKNKEKIRKHLVFCSTFLLVYEYFVSSWKQGVFFLYTYCKKDIDTNSNVFHTDMVFRKIRFEAFEDLKKNQKSTRKTIKQDYDNLETKYNNGVKQLMFLWMFEHGFITEQDMKTLENCHIQRNVYAHEIDQSLKNDIIQKEKDLLKSLIEIAIKVSYKWNDIVKRSTPSIGAFLKEVAEDNNLDASAFPTNTERFLSLVLENIKEDIQ